MTRTRPRTFALVATCLALGLVPRSQGARPADPLLRLVPPDAAVTLAVEDLRGQTRAALVSSLVRGLKGLPVVAQWLGSEPYREVRESLARVEAGLGVDLATLRDRVFGEAAVLSLRIAADRGAESARGLLLLKVTDRALLTQLIDRLNAAQRDAGELERVEDRRHGRAGYQARVFREGTRPAEFYALFETDVFAWSNSEELLKGVLDRRAGAARGLSDLDTFRAVRDRLPASAAVSLFADPRALEPFLDMSAAPGTPEEARVLAFLTGYLRAVRYAGAAIEWRDGVVLHTEESVDPERLDADLKTWGASPSRGEPHWPRVPSGALALAHLSIDPAVVLAAFERVVPDAERNKLANFWLLLDGLCLGMKAREEVLPRLGPDVFAFVGRPEGELQPGKPFPAVLSLRLPGGPEGARLGAALTNAVRTFMALRCLDEKRAQDGLRVETRAIDGVAVTSFLPAKEFAFAASEGQFLIGNVPEAVGRAAGGSGTPPELEPFRRLRMTHLADAGSFACLDLRSLTDFADAQAPALAHRLADHQGRPYAETSHDLGQALDLLKLFDAAFLTSTVDPGFARVHRSVGLFGRAAR